MLSMFVDDERGTRSLELSRERRKKIIAGVGSIEAAFEKELRK